MGDDFRMGAECCRWNSIQTVEPLYTGVGPLYTGVGAGIFWRVRRILSRISSNLPEKNLCGKLSHTDFL